MALTIESDEADRLACELAAATGESMTEAVIKALAERLERCNGPDRRTRDPERERRLDEIIARARALAKHDPRTDDEIVGYNEFGAFD